MNMVDVLLFFLQRRIFFYPVSISNRTYLDIYSLKQPNIKFAHTEISNLVLLLRSHGMMNYLGNTLDTIPGKLDVEIRVIGELQENVHHVPGHKAIPL